MPNTTVELHPEPKHYEGIMMTIKPLYNTTVDLHPKPYEGKTFTIMTIKTLVSFI